MGACCPSFEDVFRDHAAYALGLLRRLGVSEADAEDVAQEVFIIVHARLAGFEGRSALKTWICGICLRKASDYRRKAYRRRERPTAAFDADEQPLGGELRDGETQVIRQQQVATLQRALASLAANRLEVFVLYEVEELPMVEVARAVGCPLFTAYTRLRGARRDIQAFFRRAEVAQAASIHGAGVRAAAGRRQLPCVSE